MMANIKQLEANLNSSIRAALAAQQRLSDARKAAGLRDRLAIFTAADVKEMRVEWFNDWTVAFKAIQNHNRKLQSVGELATADVSRDYTAATAATANAIVRAGQKRRGEDNTADIKNRRK